MATSCDLLLYFFFFKIWNHLKKGLIIYGILVKHNASFKKKFLGGILTFKRSVTFKNNKYFS